MSILSPERANGGSSAVTITAAIFFSCMLVPAGTVIPSWDNILLRLWPVNGACIVWSPVPSSPTTSP
ncbi:Uncharacterised protein [Enterobacter cloacae]|nr:Uncharacterised protein [Enterobacter cloacae]